MYDGCFHNLDPHKMRSKAHNHYIDAVRCLRQTAVAVRVTTLFLWCGDKHQQLEIHHLSAKETGAKSLFIHSENKRHEDFNQCERHTVI